MNHVDSKQLQTHKIKPVTPADYPYFRGKLQAQTALVRSHILATLARSKSAQAIEFAAQVHDSKDDAFANRLAELDFAEMSHELTELRDIGLAERRLQLKAYGGCVDCGEAIGWQRLDAQPTATRCIACQERCEHSPAAAAAAQLPR